MSIATRFRNYFLAGILVTAPVAITFWLLWKIVGFVDGGIRPLIPPAWDPQTYLPFEIPGIGIVFVLVALFLVGSFATGVIGKLVFRYSEWILEHIPVVSSIYGWTRQIFETLLSADSSAFREVVLIEYPYRGSWAIGFITGETEGEIQDLSEETLFNVFVPATPNPTTGFLLFVPENDLRRLDLGIDDGIKLVISGGMVAPDSGHEASALAGGTVIGEEMDRLRASVEEERLESKREGTWGGGAVFGDDLERIKRALAEAHPEERPPTLIGTIRDNLLAGLLVTAPIAITIWLCLAVIDYFDEIVLPMIPAQWNPANYLPFAVPGLGLIAAVLSMTLIGFLTAGFLGGAIVGLGERMIAGLPVVRGIYAAVKQVFETLFKDQSKAFREVALVQYPRRDVWAIGFMTGDTARQIHDTGVVESVNIFLPTTPNPTSGFLLFLPKSETKHLSMTVEQGLKMVISGGIVTPESGSDDAEQSDGPPEADTTPSSPERPG